MIWKLKLDEHPAARITGSPVFYEGRLFVPMGSLEEASGMAPESRYECCTFRGSLIALDAETGRQLWKSFTVLDPPKPYKKSRNGTQMYGPAGAAIWSAPTIDAKRNLIYAATGDSYTPVENPTSDAILAFNMDNGSLVWSRQTTANDNFIGGCPASPNCPEVVGPDVDFGSSPMLLPIDGGKQIIVAGQKSGIVWGLDPDQKGKVLWNTKLGVGGLMGGVEWGAGADSDRAYVAISDLDVPAGRAGHISTEPRNRTKAMEYASSQGDLCAYRMPISAIGGCVGDSRRGVLGRAERSFPRLLDQDRRDPLGFRHAAIF